MQRGRLTIEAQKLQNDIFRILQESPEGKTTRELKAITGKRYNLIANAIDELSLHSKPIYKDEGKWRLLDWRTLEATR